MAHWVRQIASAALACAALALGCGKGSAAHHGDCRKTAMTALRDSASDGFAIYQQLQDKTFFFNWVRCEDPQLGLPTAVHESVHFVTADIDAFPLIDGGEIKRPHEVTRFFAPSRIASEFKNDDFVSTYLKPGRATSSSDFLYLLDEMNAYTHDLNAALDLKSLRRDDLASDSRDGLAALMAFVALYVERAERSEPATWEGLQKPEAAKAVTTLWGAAEKVMTASCGVPNLGDHDKTYIRMFCRAEPQAALASLMGQASVCPTACLKAEPESAQSASLVEDETPDPRAHTLWSRRGSRRQMVETPPEAEQGGE